MEFSVLTADISKLSSYILRSSNCDIILLLPISIAFTTLRGFWLSQPGQTAP